jgi:tetratricopeptide (TPR) repeat protein
MRVRGFVGVLVVAAILTAASGCDTVRIRTTLNKGNEYYAGQRYEEAIGEYDKVLAIDPSNWQANYLKSVSYLALYKPGSTHPKDLEYSTKGIASFEKLLKLPAPTPDEAEKVRGFYLGFLNGAEMKDKALEFMKAELETNPTNVALISQIADMYLKAGDFPQALAYFEKRASLEPDNKEAWYTIGVSCWARSYHGGMMVSQEERGQVVQKGIEALDKAMAIEPNYFDALSYTNLLYREKAKYLASIGQSMEAGEAYMKADEYLKKALEVRKGQTQGKSKA